MLKAIEMLTFLYPHRKHRTETCPACLLRQEREQSKGKEKKITASGCSVKLLDNNAANTLLRLRMQQIYQKDKIPSPGVVLAVMNLQEFPYFHFYTSLSGLRRKPSLQEWSQPLLYRQWLVHPGCFAPTDCDNPIVFKEMAAHLRYSFLGLAYGRAPCQFSCQIFHFQPWYRSQANQITEKVVQEDISSSLDGYQPPSLQNEACHKLFFSPTIHIQFTYNISPPHSI